MPIIDHTTGSPIHVLTDEAAGSYIRLPYDQLDEIRRILDTNGIPYRVRENIVSLSGGPFIAVVYLDRAADAAVVQSLLAR